MIFKLLEELIVRIEQMRHSIRMVVLHTKVNQNFQQKIDTHLKHIKFEILEILGSEYRNLPSNIVGINFYSDYRLCCERIHEIEYHGVQVLRKYGDREYYFLNLIKEIIQNQLRVSISIPMVTTIKSNNEYFWADIGYELIGIPSGEEYHLTSLPDLIHEISHFIIGNPNINVWLIGDITTKINNHFDKEFADAEDRARSSQKLLRDLPIWKNNWNDKWLIEFSCDMLATYFVGSAYAWTNLKISAADLPKDIYSVDKKEHPSHEARMRAINEMLIMIGEESEIASINKEWDELLNFPNYDKPNNYGMVFPEILLKNLAFNIYTGCQKMGYLSYPEQMNQIEYPISKLMNDAWHFLLAEPSKYNIWEKEQIKILHKKFNFESSDVQNT